MFIYVCCFFNRNVPSALWRFSLYNFPCLTSVSDNRFTLPVSAIMFCYFTSFSIVSGLVPMRVIADSFLPISLSE